MRAVILLILNLLLLTIKNNITMCLVMVYSLSYSLLCFLSWNALMDFKFYNCVSVLNFEILLCDQVALEIKKDNKNVVYVQGAIIRRAVSANHLLSIFKQGISSRHIAETSKWQLKETHICTTYKHTCNPFRAIARKSNHKFP